MGKGGNAGFSFSHNVFKRLLSEGRLKSGLFVKGLSMVQIIELVFSRVENIVRKGENARNQHFLLFAQYFPNASTSGRLKVGIVW